MTTLREYVRSTGLKALAERMDVHVSTVHRWSTGEIVVPAERAAPLEKATDGAVKRHEIRPDIFDEVGA